MRQRRGAPRSTRASTGRARRRAPRGCRRAAARAARSCRGCARRRGAGRAGGGELAAIARPMPRFEPVTSAVSPFRSIEAGYAARKRMTSLNHIRRGRGEPLLLIHPLGADIVVGARTRHAAAQREVIAVDMPGFGTSPPLANGTPQRRMHWPPPWRASSTRSGSSACTWRATRWAAGWRSSWRRRAGAVGDRAVLGRFLDAPARPARRPRRAPRRPRAPAVRAGVSAQPARPAFCSAPLSAIPSACRRPRRRGSSAPT